MSKYLYLYLTFPSQKNYPLRSTLTNKTNVIPSRTNFLKKTLFLLHAEVRDAKSIHFFKKMIVTGKFPFSVYDPLVKLLTRLRLQFSHLNEHRFIQGFYDTVSPMCGCDAEVEDTEHFLLHCFFYSIQRF